MKNEILTIRDLRGGYQESADIIRGLSLALYKGEAIGVLGLNGSGKSTFGKALMNLLPYQSGEIIFNGVNIAGMSTYKLSKLGLSIMHQGGAIFKGLSVWENLQLVTDSHSQSYNEALQALIPILSRPKKELMRIKADSLSGGERHELALAMTLAGSPKVVILDEPSAGLSPTAVESMYSLLSEIRNSYGISMILIEQNISRAVSFCDSCVMMEEGRFKYVFNEKNIAEIESKLFNNK